MRRRVSAPVLSRFLARGLRAILVAASVILASNCGGSSLLAPVLGSKPKLLLIFGASPGSYSATLNGQTYSADGGFQISLDSGTTYTVSGTFKTPIFVVIFSNVGGGGALSGSVRSLSGPVSSSSATGPCSVGYDNIATPSVSRTFSIQFQATASTNSACQ